MAELDTLTTPVSPVLDAPVPAAIEALDAAGSAVTEDTEQVEGQEPVEGQEEAEEFEVEVTHPSRGEDGPGEKSKLIVPDQKTADTLRFNQNQAALVPKLEARLADAEQSVAILDAMDKDPVAAMQLLANDPKVSAEFGKSFVREHYLEVAAYLKEMGLVVQMAEGTNQRTLDLEAQVARRDREQRLEKSRAASQTNTLQSAFQVRAKGVVDGLAQTIAFGDEDDKSLFYRATSDKLAKLYHTNPYATPAEQTAAIQSLVGKFAGRATTTIKTKVVRDAEGKFQAQKSINGKMGKIAGGQNGITPQTPHFDPSESLESFTQRLEGRKR